MPAIRHLVLLGDSIFDNGVYTRGEPDVVTHLRELLPADSQATLLALDGARVAHVEAQLHDVPADASHLLISMGGNDALHNADLLTLPVSSSGQALLAFAARLADFEVAYRRVLAQAVALGRKTAVCTIYDGALEPARATAARIGVALFNDVIVRAAVDARVDVLELRSVCTEPADYANPIEPSGRGGRKIARALAVMTGALMPPVSSSRVWGRVE